MTNFEKITASPERLAKELLYFKYEREERWGAEELKGKGKFCWVSHNTHDDTCFTTRKEAVEHTIDWLKQEAGS